MAAYGKDVPRLFRKIIKRREGVVNEGVDRDILSNVVLLCDFDGTLELLGGVVVVKVVVGGLRVSIDALFIDALFGLVHMIGSVI